MLRFLPNPPTNRQGEEGKKFARMPKNELSTYFLAFLKGGSIGVEKVAIGNTAAGKLLKEVLTGIADLHKRGPYVGKLESKT